MQSVAEREKENIAVLPDMPAGTLDSYARIVYGITKGDVRMEVVRCYMDLCREIERYEERLESLMARKESMVERWLQPLSDVSGIDYARPKVQGGKKRIDMEEELVHLASTEEGIEKYKTLLKKLRESRDRMKVCIDGTTDIVYKIAFKKMVEGKSLLVISEELNYSYNYIRNISSKKLGKMRVG